MQTLTYALDTTWRTLLADLGVVPANVLRRAGLPDDLLHQPSVRLEPEDYYRLWESAEQEKGDPLFPIRVCEAVRAESFSPPLFAALCSPNLVVAAQRVAKYKKLIGPMQMEAHDDRDMLTIEFAWHDGPPPPMSLATMELLFWATLARIGTREAISPVDVTTTALPSPLAPYEDFLGARLSRGPRHLIRFAKSDAIRPFLTSNEPLWAAFEPDLRQRLADLDASVSVAKRVRAALHEAIPSGLTTMEAIARKLAVSKRTLQRRIEAEGTSFQQILKETREALARHYLEKTALPASEISFLLGFDEPNSFYRAFRSWTGKTPDSIRQHA
ncbi:AraC family transcriptional regulator [Neorhizobium galegae]|uniref:AraC family transcriptional regulator n=1 Tax=Neorhizobium galegae TaxID=399 RepID=UPI002103FF04|nr:AraC family transcriptional regulator [Neorhizobium galegae]MCQ1851410.1 AraC family transcriptional regulator [Neorhizobium galegae]